VFGEEELLEDEPDPACAQRSIRIAKSRLPAGVSRSQLVSNSCTCSAASPRGSPSRRLRTDGTAAANGVAIQPCTCKNRSSARSAHTTISACRWLRWRASRNTNAWISQPERLARSSAIGSERCSRNWRATGSYCPTVPGVTPRSTSK
jgi:hypothetical protein